MRTRKTVLVTLAMALALCSVLAVLASRSGHFTFHPPIRRRAAFVPAAGTVLPPALQARGKRLVTDAGETVLLRGVMLPEPTRVHATGKFSRAFLAEIRKTGANVIRVPVHPAYWVRDPDYLWRYLDPLVRWSGELGMYVIIDWHYIGNPATGAGPEMPDIAERPRDLSLAFWRSVALYFRAAPHAIFEVFNEPAGIEAAAWRQSALELVQAVRAQGASQLIIVGGIDYGRDLSWVLQDPLPEPNVAYASHIYPAHPAGGWDAWLGRVAEHYPVLVTEWGFMDENRNAGKAYLGGDRLTYGEPFLAYLAARGIGWVACWYDDTWEPPMFRPGWRSRTRWGDFVLEQLRASARD